MLEFEELNLNDINWTILDSFQDRTVCQTKEWLEFIQKTQNAKPVLLKLKKGNETVGFFTGGIVKKFGIKILGSPFRGWTTSYMGFNLSPNIRRGDALKALTSFAFKKLRCFHLEIMDRRLSEQDVTQSGFKFDTFQGYEIDLTQSKEELFSKMTSSCRRCIRKSKKNGVTFQEANDVSFADDYYAQLEDVFAKQKLVPTYSKQRVEDLIECMIDTGKILLLKALNVEGTCIATGIFPAMNDTAYFWGGASWRRFQILRPNEAIQWYAMLHWKERGIKRYDMGGGGHYKAKYGGQRIFVPWARKSRYQIIEQQRASAKILYKSLQKIVGLRKV
jgi:CelD/BcsL family acetyltransferase involved in cellulose biosynthesis